MSPEHTSTWSDAKLYALGVTTDLVTAGSILGIGRTKSHELARAGEFPVPVLRHGRRYVVPVAHLLRLLGLDEPTARNDPTPTSPDSPAANTPRAPLHRGSPFARESAAGGHRDTQGQHHPVHAFSGGQLSLLRRRHTLTIERLARLAQLSAHVIARCEAGQVKPDADTVIALARALGAKPIELLHKNAHEPGLQHLRITNGLTVEDIITRALGHPLGDVLTRERYARLEAGSLEPMSTIDGIILAHAFRLEETTIRQAHLQAASDHQ